MSSERGQLGARACGVGLLFAWSLAVACGDDAPVDDRSGPRAGKPGTNQGGSSAGDGDLPGGQDTSGGANTSGTGGTGGSAAGGVDSGGTSAGGSDSGGAGTTGGDGATGGDSTTGGNAGTSGSDAGGGAGVTGGTSAGGTMGGAAPGGTGGSPGGAGAGGGTAGSGGNQTVLYFEDFEDGLGRWQDSRDSFGNDHGGWAVFVPDETPNYVYRGTENGTDMTWAILDYDWTDVRIEVDLRVTPYGKDWLFYVASRVQSAQSQQHVVVRADRSVELRERANSATTTLATTTGPEIRTNRWHQVVLTSSGSSLSAHIDGALVLQASGATLVRGGIAFAVNEAGIDFDNVRVTVP